MKRLTYKKMNGRTNGVVSKVVIAKSGGMYRVVIISSPARSTFFTTIEELIKGTIVTRVDAFSLTEAKILARKALEEFGVKFDIEIRLRKPKAK